MSELNEHLEILRVQCAKIGLKINVKKTKLPRLGINVDEQETFDNEDIDQVDSFTSLGSIITKHPGSSKDVKNRITKVQGFFHCWEKFER